MAGFGNVRCKIRERKEGIILIRKNFTLIELIIATVILSILSSTVYFSVKNQKENAINAEMSSNISVYQVAVDHYRLDKGEYPTEIQPTIKSPEAIDYEKVFPKYVKTIEPLHGNYWVDNYGKVWGSSLPLINNISIEKGKITFDKVQEAKSYNVYQYNSSTNKSKKIASIEPNEPFIELPDTLPKNVIILVSGVDRFGLETAPNGEEWIERSDDFIPLKDLKAGTYHFTTNANEIATWTGWSKDDSIPEGASIDYSFATSNDNITYTDYLEEFPLTVKAQFMRVKVTLKDNAEGEVPKLNRLRVSFELDAIIDDSTIKPVAIIDMYPSTKVTPKTSISWNSAGSYSPDKKKIVEEEWKNKSEFYPVGNHLVELRVKNSAGVWSDWESKRFDVKELENPYVPPNPEKPDITRKPIAIINYTPKTAIYEKTLVIWDSFKSYSPDGLAIVDEEWKNRNTNYAAGPQKVELRVKDSNGNWSDWVSVTLQVKMPKPVAVIEYEPKTDIYFDTTITWSSDSSYSPEGLAITDVEWKNNEDTYVAGNHKVELRVKDEENNWSDWVSTNIRVKNSKPIAVIDYSPKTNLREDSTFIWNSDKSYSPDGLEITEEEWDNKMSTYAIGSHVVKLRVKDSNENWSNWVSKTIKIEEEIIVKPVAVITYSPTTTLRPSTVIKWDSSNSYSPDGKSIVEAEWKNKQDTYEVGTHVIELRVKNDANVWSDWKTKSIAVKDIPIVKPIAVISQTPTANITPATEITWGSENSYSPEGLSIVNEEWKNKLSHYPEGNHSVQLRVQDSAGTWSEWVTKSVKSLLPVAVIEYSPTGKLLENSIITWNSDKSHSPDGLKITEVEWKNKAASYLVGSHTVQLRVKNEADIWSNWASKTIVISPYDKPVAVIGMTPNDGLYPYTSIKWDSNASYDPNGFGFTITDQEWQNKQDIYEEGKHTIRLRVQNSQGIWSDWVNKNFEVKSEWETIDEMDYEVDAGIKGKWLSTVIDDLQPTDTRIVYEYSTSNDLTSWSKANTDITKLSESRYLNVKIIRQRKVGTDVEPTFLNIMVNYYNTKGNRSTVIEEKLNLQKLQEAISQYYADNNQYPTFGQPTDTEMKALDINELYPNYINIKANDNIQTYWVDHNGQIHGSNTALLFKKDRIGNMINGGLFEERNGFIYYNNPKDNTFYQMNANHLSKKQLSTTKPTSITKNKDIIYFSEVNKLYTTTDGLSKRSLSVSSFGPIYAFDDWVYTADINGYIQRVRPDGSSLSKIGNKRGNYLNVVGDWIYFSDAENGNRLTKMRTDGAEIAVLSTAGSATYINVVDDYVYFKESSKLYKIKTDGTGKTLVLDVNASYLNVVEDWIYYSNYADGYSLYKVKIDGKENTKLNDDYTKKIHVLGDWIYYENGDDRNTFYKIKTNGTERSPFDQSIELSTLGVSNTLLQGNSLNGGLFSENEGFPNKLYYINPSNGYLQFKYIEAEEIEVIAPIKLTNMTVAGNYIYGSYKQDLYRMNLNGSNLKLLSTVSPKNIIVQGNWVYFTEETNYTLYRVQIDGNNEAKIVNDGATDFVVEGDSLYYINRQESSRIYKVKIDGTNKEKISNNAATYLNISDDWLYYRNGTSTTNRNSVFKMKTDGTEETPLNNVNSTQINVADGWVYYSNQSDNSSIYKMKTDGSENAKLNNDRSSEIHIVGNWVYYKNNNDSGRYYRIKKDGTERGHFEKTTIDLPTGEENIVFNQSNSSNGGLFAEDGINNWNYFIDPATRYINRMTLEGTNVEQVSTLKTTNLTLMDDFMYFENNTDLYRSSMDGTDIQLLSKEYAMDIKVQGDWVFYMNTPIGTNTTSKLFKVQMNGTNEIKVINDTVESYAVKGEWIYYVNATDSYKLYKIKVDGTERTKLSEISSRSIILYEDQLYFRNVTGSNFLFKMNLDGSELTALTTDNIKTLNAANGWIYYLNSKDGSSIYRIKPDGTENTKLNDDQSSEVHVIGDWIFYKNEEDSSRYYKLKIDGSERGYFLSSLNETPIGSELVTFNKSNSANGGLFAEDGLADWNYYINQTTGNVHKMTAEGKFNTEVFAHKSKVTELSVTSDYLYMNLGGKLHRSNLDGTNLLLLSSKNVSNIIVEGDWVYYLLNSTATSTTKPVYRVQIDGSNEMKVINTSVYSFDLQGDWIYYVNEGESYKPYKVKVNGTMKTKLTDNATRDLVVDNEWIYYRNVSDKNYLYKIKTDGSENTLVNAAYTTYLNFSDGWIYYSNQSEDNSIYRIKPDGSENTKIIGNKAYRLYIISDWVYYENANDSSRYYKVKVDGTKRSLFESVWDKTPIGSPYSTNNPNNARTNGKLEQVAGSNWVYYVHPTTGYLHKMDSSGKNNTVVSTFKVEQFTVTPDYIFVNSGNKLYRTNLDGSNMLLLSSRSVENITVQGDWVYYKTKLLNGFGNNLFKVRIDGQDQMSVTYDSMPEFVVQGDWIYYPNVNDANKLYRINADGTIREKISNYAGTYLSIDGDWLFYRNTNDKGYLYKVKTDGTSESLVLNKAVSHLNASNDWIYYSDQVDGASMYKIKPDGTKSTKLNSDSSREMIIMGDWAYYLNYSDAGRFYKVKVDGSERGYFEDTLEISPFGNTASTENIGNSINGGLFSYNSSSNLVYYRQPTTTGYLYKAVPDGNGAVSLGTTFRTTVLTSANGWIYNNYNSGITKVKDDGTESLKISSKAADNLIVAGDWVYFKDRTALAPYKVNINGDNETKISNIKMNSFTYLNGWLYYSNADDVGKLYKIKADGTQNTKILEDTVSWVQTSNGFIYFTNGKDGNSVYRVLPDGSSKIKVITANANFLNVVGNWIYFSNTGDLKKLYKVKTDGSGLVKLNDDNTANIHVTGNWIHYYNATDKKYYRIKEDGTTKTLIQ